MHQTIVDFVRGALAGQAEADRLIDCYVVFAEKQIGDDDALEKDLDNITTALALAEVADRPEALSRGTVALSNFSTRRGYLLLVRRLLEAAAQRITVDLSDDLRARVFLALGDNAARRGEFQDGLAAGETESARAMLASVLELEADGVLVPRHAQLTRYETAVALGDPQAARLISKVHADLLSAAEMIEDPRLRFSFLENVSENRAIRATFNRK